MRHSAAMTPPRLPYIDEHAIVVARPRDRVWVALEQETAGMLLGSGRGPLRRLLGTDPPAGFGVASSSPAERLELEGRHRFARYKLTFVLTDAPADATRVVAQTIAEFPGVHGRVYRALVIGTGLHVVAMRRLLGSVRRACVAQV